MSVHKRKNNGTYYVHYRDENGRQKTKTFGKNKAGHDEALAFHHEVLAKKKRHQPITPPRGSGIYLDELAQLYDDSKRARGPVKRWYEEWVQTLNKHILPVLTKRPIDLMGEAEIVGFIGQKYADREWTTRNRYLSYLKVLFNWGVRYDYIKQSPLRFWVKKKEPSRDSLLTVADLERIHQHAAPHLQFAIEVAFNFGVRTGQSELLSLRWDRIDWDRSIIRVEGTKTETSRREVPITPEFLERLREQRPKAETPFLVEYKGRKIKSLRKAFRRACERAGITYDLDSYDIRHLFATTAITNGADMAAVSKIMGHASIKMTVDVYYRALEEEKRRAVRVLPQLKLGKTGT